MADPIKATHAARRSTQLRDAGIRIVMATGDGLTTARAVARELGIDEVHGEVQARRTSSTLVAAASRGPRVAMAGDGINDAPALAQADVGIAMGTGTDVAMNSAQVTLVKGDLRGIARARAAFAGDRAQHEAEPGLRVRLQRAGRADRRGRALSVLGLLLSPMFAALAMSLSSVSVVANALRLRRAS